MRILKRSFQRITNKNKYLSIIDHSHFGAMTTNSESNITIKHNIFQELNLGRPVLLGYLQSITEELSPGLPRTNSRGGA